jgi:hypothetical protein
MWDDNGMSSIFVPVFLVAAFRVHQLPTFCFQPFDDSLAIPVDDHLCPALQLSPQPRILVC